MKYIFITGGVASSLGKGITAASLGRLIKSRGYTVSLMKLDPYYNIDQGLLSPLQRGEVYITNDGFACDHDLGHYERFTDVTLTGSASVSAGQIYKTIMENETRGMYRGETIQMVPHFTNEIKRRVAQANASAEVAIIEIGGTVGDMESAAFLEAARQMKWELPEGDCLFVHVTFLPTVGQDKEIKTKPTQHSVKALRSLGLQPDIVVCRTNVPVNAESREKIALFCNVLPENVIENIDKEVLYEIPLALESEGLCEKALNLLQLDARTANLATWQAMTAKAKAWIKTIRVGLVGKYIEVRDAYLSVVEALAHAGIATGVRVEIDWIPSFRIERDGADATLARLDAIIAPSGHGKRGAEGIILAAQFAYTHKIPFLSIGYGMQLTVAAAARSLLGLPEANSQEANPATPDPVSRVPKDREGKTGRERLRSGAQICYLTGSSRLSSIYNGAREIVERHGNRFEINMAYVPPLAEKGVKFPAIEKSEGYIEAVERPDHPFYIGVMYHPEFLSRPDKPHPLFTAFVESAVGH